MDVRVLSSGCYLFRVDINVLLVGPCSVVARCSEWMLGCC